MTENKNELVLSGKDFANQLIPNLFSDIDFDGLNNVIDNMANVSGALSDDDKDFARNLISEWNDTVIIRLNDKNSEAQGFVRFFEPNNQDLYLNHLAFEDFAYDVADKTNTIPQYEAVVKAQEELELFKSTKPESVTTDPDLPLTEDIKRRQQYEADYAIYQLRMDKLKRQLSLAITKWKREMGKEKVIKDLLTQSRKMANGTAKMRDAATSKAQLAKLNITISDQATREALKELVEFSINI